MSNENAEFYICLFSSFFEDDEISKAMDFIKKIENPSAKARIWKDMKQSFISDCCINRVEKFDIIEAVYKSVLGYIVDVLSNKILAVFDSIWVSGHHKEAQYTSSEVYYHKLRLTNISNITDAIIEICNNIEFYRENLK